MNVAATPASPGLLISANWCWCLRALPLFPLQKRTSCARPASRTALQGPGYSASVSSNLMWKTELEEPARPRSHTEATGSAQQSGHGLFLILWKSFFFFACLVTSASGQGEMLPSAQIFRPKGEIVNSIHENDSETRRDPYGHLNEMPILVEFHFVHFMNFVIHPFLGDNRKPKQKSYNREQLLWCPVKRWAKFNTVQTRTNRTSYFNTEPPP